VTKPPKERRLGRFGRGALYVLAVGYLVAILVIAVMIRIVGEGWWLSGFVMFLPQIFWALPLPPIVALLAFARLRRLLWTQLAAGLVWLFVLMGFNVPFRSSLDEDQPKLRVMSFNVNSCAFGVDTVAQQIVELSPDILLVQELFSNGQELSKKLAQKYAHVQVNGQFMIATNYPILTTTEPDRVPVGDITRTARFVQYELETPLGRMDVFNMHPLSPRGALSQVRAGGFRRQLLGLHIFDGEVAKVANGYTMVRHAEMGALSAAAARSTNPVLIAGDTNLPSFSPDLGRFFGDYRDGFREHGFGFGFTFPSRQGWMRLDRIFTSKDLKFVDFEIGCAQNLSDHLCVLGTVQKH
jgi:endonuclease/exonuclease/phosphatase family metal-dependent hydrolase